MLEWQPNWGLCSRSFRALMASTVKHYLPPRRTLRCPSEKRWPTEQWEKMVLLAEPAAVVARRTSLRGRYGGRARRGMKKSFAGGILSLVGVSSVRNRYRSEVSGLAEEVVCDVGFCLRLDYWGRGWCYRGLVEFAS